MWGAKYQVVVTTHLNTDNIRNHFVINSVSFVDGRKFRNGIGDRLELRKISDTICAARNKSVIQSHKFRAAFEQVPDAVLNSLEKAGYERSDALMLSREITAEGKSTCRINGMPATASVLRELCGGLININGQHDSVGLLNPARHLGILDDYAQNDAEFQEYYVLYRELVRIKRELDAMITDEAEKQRKIDLLSYQVQEIEDAGLTAGEEQTLESRRKILANASAMDKGHHQTRHSQLLSRI